MSHSDPIQRLEAEVQRLESVISKQDPRLAQLIAKWRDEADYLAIAPPEEGADRDWFRAQREAYDKVLAALRAVPPQPPISESLHTIGVMAMVAASDPHSSADTYRKALTDICNFALKAQEPGAVPPQQEQETDRARIEALLPYLREVLLSHCDPNSSDYNECEKAQCAWCEGVSAALRAVRSQPIDKE